MRKLLLFTAALLCAASMWADKPSWVQPGDEWDSEDSTLTVNSNPERQIYQYQADIRHVIFSDAVTNTGELTFFNCSGLKTVTIGNSVDTIKSEAFLQCYALTTVTMGNSVRVIEWGAFRSCNNLATIELPNSVTKIQSVAFEGCTSLTTFTIPKNVVEIQDQAFRGCTGVTDVYCYPLAANLEWSTTIWEFKGQYNGTRCHVLANQLSAYESKIQYISFYGDLFDPDPSVWVLEGDVWDADTKTLTVNSNPIDQAYDNNPLIQHLIISDAVTSIGIQAFSRCSVLTSATIPNSVENIGAVAFASCSSLTSVTIPSSVENIGAVAFAGCSNLSSVICKAVNPPTLDDDVFVDDNSLAHIYVPAESVSTYKAATKWSAHEDIIEAILPVEIDFRTNPYTVSSGAATLISGSWNDGTHGYHNPVVSVPLLAGNYKITVGNCQYGNASGAVRNADGSDVLDLIDENGQTITSFTTPKNCYNNDDKTTSVWYVAATDQTIRVVCPEYTPYLKVESVESVPEAVTVYTVTFANAEGATGIVPAAKANLTPNTEITLPKNFTMYKSGATFTEWTDGSNTYAPNTSYTVTDNVTLTAVYSDNTVALDDRTAATTIKWLFSQSDGVPAIDVSGSTTFVVAQAEVADKKIDVQLLIDATVSGKFVNSSNTWTQINPGVIFTIPSAKDAVITYKQYNAGEVTTPSINVTASDATYDLTAEGTIGQLYYEYIQVVLPEPDPTGMEEANANAKAIKLLRDGQLLIIKNGKTYNAQGIVVK